jgi:hypothetical protein
VKRLLLALLVASLAGTALLVGSARASSLSSCGNRVINDWYDNGRIDHTYPIACYRDALRHLPEDVRQYADAHDVITRAMTAAIVAKTSREQHSQSTDTTSTDTTQTSTNKSGPAVPPSDKNPPPGTGPASSHHDPLIKNALNRLGPNNANSLPLPLVVLGGLALLLLAAGAAGVVARKLQERRVPGTPGGGAPPEAPSAS